MPTAGEARLKANSIKKASIINGASCKGKATRNKPGASKIGEVKKRTVSHPNSAKSSIPVPVKKGAKGKENADPNVDLGTKINKKASKVKQAPDFRKLHRKWDDQLSKGKAVSKKKNTTIEPFKLAENNQQSIKKFKRPYAYNSEDEEDNVLYDDEDDDFEIDSTALKGILNNTGIKEEDLRITGRATIAAIPSSKSELAIAQPSEVILKRSSIYYTRPPPQNAAGASSSVSKLGSTSSTSQTTVCPLKPRNVDIAPAARSQVASCARKQVAWADEVPENDALDFQPDSQALQSILSNTGISFNQMSAQNTGRVTVAGGRLTPYRRARQSFREESSKRTSIYYTGPRRTRPSPRACGMGTSVLGANQLTASSAVNSQKSAAYDPLQTVVGRQGNQEQENEPLESLGAMQFPTGRPEPGFQTTGDKALLTPGRKLVSSTQSSFARDQPSWAEIFTPQRSARVQESAVQGTHSQPSLEPLRTPARQQGAQEDICTPQRLLLGTPSSGVAQGRVRSTFANTSSSSIRQPLVEFKQQHSALTVDLQRNHDTMATPARQPQIGSQVPRYDFPPKCSHVPSSQLPVRSFTTPVQQGALVSQCLSSDQLPPRSEIFTPQRFTRENVASKNMAAHSFNDPLVTPLRQNLPATKEPCSTHRHQPQMADIFASQQNGDAIQDLGPRLRCSTVQITSFQPSVDTTRGSYSMEKLLTPQQKDGSRKELPKLTSVEEEDDVALLERQALEDLGLLKIKDGSPKDLAASCTKIEENSDAMCSPLFNTWTDLSRSAAAGTNISNTLRTSSFTPRERELVTSRDISPIPLNFTPLLSHQELSENSAPLVERTGTGSALCQRSSFTKYSKINSDHATATYREPRVTSASSTNPVETPASKSKVAPSKERDDRPIQVVSPTPKVQHYKHAPSDSRSLSLRSAVLSLNPGSFSHRTTAAPSNGGVNTQFRWELNGPENTPSAFRPTTSASRRLPNTLAQDALLDVEVSVYMTAGHDRVVTARDRPMNPLAKVFSEGDSMHFLPICVHQSL